jgi:hypothetical protein
MSTCYTRLVELNKYASELPEVTEESKVPVQVALKICSLSVPSERHKPHLLALLTDADSDIPVSKRKQTEMHIPKHQTHAGQYAISRSTPSIETITTTLFWRMYLACRTFATKVASHDRT